MRPPFILCIHMTGKRVFGIGIPQNTCHALIVFQRKVSKGYVYERIGRRANPTPVFPPPGGEIIRPQKPLLGSCPATRTAGDGCPRPRAG